MCRCMRVGGWVGASDFSYVVVGLCAAGRTDDPSIITSYILKPGHREGGGGGRGRGGGGRGRAGQHVRLEKEEEEGQEGCVRASLLYMYMYYMCTYVCVSTK